MVNNMFRVTALGGYREVGRSCHLLMTKDSKVLIDCGFNPGNDKEPSPFLSAPEATPLEGNRCSCSHSCAFRSFCFTANVICLWF